MKTPYTWPLAGQSLLVCGLLLLGACAPALTPAGPSVALKQQFAQIQLQQRQQAAQIKALQQQLEQLQKAPLDTVATSEIPQSLESSAPAISTAQPEPLIIPAAITQEITALADSAATYLDAFTNLATGRFVVAETGFTRFLNSYPEHQYAPNARYWLASAQLSQGKLPTAASNLRRVIVDINGQERAPAALVLLAKIYRQQQLNHEADEVLEQLRNRYPESSEAQQFYQSDVPRQ